MITIEPWGSLPDGRGVDRILLRHNQGLSAAILTYGATLQSFLVPTANGSERDIVLGFDRLEGYLSPENAYLGATIGPNANRLRNASFALDDQSFTLERNEGENNLHSGSTGFHQAIWTLVEKNDDLSLIRLRLLVPDGTGGFPGNLNVSLTVTLLADGLRLDYTITADRTALINPTNHAYFNLKGHGAGSIEDHALWIAADRFSAVDAELLPDGRLLSVNGTPFDFREAKKIGQDIGADDQQLRLASGYDHNFVLRGTPGALNPVARASVDDLSLTLETTLRCLQFYAGNFLDVRQGKAGARYERRSGFCLETQFMPDAPNHPAFRQPVYERHMPYRQTSIYRLS